jgi:hypothetical protein
MLALICSPWDAPGCWSGVAACSCTSLRPSMWRRKFCPLWLNGHRSLQDQFVSRRRHWIRAAFIRWFSRPERFCLAVTRMANYYSWRVRTQRRRLQERDWAFVLTVMTFGSVIVSYSWDNWVWYRIRESVHNTYMGKVVQAVVPLYNVEFTWLSWYGNTQQSSLSDGPRSQSESS